MESTIQPLQPKIVYYTPAKPPRKTAPTLKSLNKALDALAERMDEVERLVNIALDELNL